LTEHDWMIYGATGFTGALVTEEAVRRGHRPLLAGRSESKLKALAGRLGLNYVTVSLNDMAALTQAVKRVRLVFHCAGPFSQTSAPMLRACLTAGAHYLDITGELPVFENVYAYDSAAKQRRIALIPGCGMDVIPTEGLARYVADQIKDPLELEIAFTSTLTRRPSTGTGQSAIEIIARGGLERRNGQLAALPLGQGGQQVRFSHGERYAIPIPWGDLSAAHRATGIPNITTLMAMRRTQARLAQLFGPLAGLLLNVPPIRRLAQGIAGRTQAGPDAKTRQTGRTHVWARAMDVKGNTAEAWLDTLEAYQFTAVAGVSAVEKTLAGKLSGALTPSQAFGADFVLEIQTTKRMDSLKQY